MAAYILNDVAQKRKRLKKPVYKYKNGCLIAAVIINVNVCSTICFGC